MCMNSRTEQEIIDHKHGWANQGWLILFCSVHKLLREKTGKRVKAGRRKGEHAQGLPFWAGHPHPCQSGSLRKSNPPAYVTTVKFLLFASEHILNFYGAYYIPKKIGIILLILGENILVCKNIIRNLQSYHREEHT